MTPDETTLLEAIQRGNRALCQALHPFAAIAPHLRGRPTGEIIELYLNGQRIGGLPVANFMNAAQHTGWLEDDDVCETT